MMKKFIVIISMLTMIFAFSSCAAEENSVVENQVESVVSIENAENNEAETEAWREFLVDYEEWVDEYIALYKKYKENPTDLTLLSEYTEMAQEISEWTEKTGEVSDELANSPKASLEYAKELSRIAKKMTDSMY